MFSLFNFSSIFHGVSRPHLLLCGDAHPLAVLTLLGGGRFVLRPFWHGVRFDWQRPLVYAAFMRFMWSRSGEATRRCRITMAVSQYCMSSLVHGTSTELN